MSCWINNIVKVSPPRKSQTIKKKKTLVKFILRVLNGHTIKYVHYFLEDLPIGYLILHVSRGLLCAVWPKMYVIMMKKTWFVFKKLCDYNYLPIFPSYTEQSNQQAKLPPKGLYRVWLCYVLCHYFFRPNKVPCLLRSRDPASRIWIFGPNSSHLLSPLSRRTRTPTLPA